MNDTPTLWDVPSQARPMVDIPLSYRKDDPDTSKQAAEDNAPRRDNQYRRILAALAEAGEAGLTDDGVSLRTQIKGNTVATRRKELEGMGLVVRTEERRKTSSNSTAIVFACSPAGFAEAMGIAS